MYFFLYSGIPQDNLFIFLRLKIFLFLKNVAVTPQDKLTPVKIVKIPKQILLVNHGRKFRSGLELYKKRPFMPTLFGS